MSGKNKHIIELLDSASIVALSNTDLARIHSHVADCSSCAQAFAAAKISSVLLKEGSPEVIEPSPFFQTRVLATLRDRQANEGWSLIRLWRSAGLLTSSMAATVATLAILTFMIPSTASTQDVSSAYSPEAIILQQGQSPEDFSDTQVLSTLYETEEEVVK
jgi:hypothetical protein